MSSVEIISCVKDGEVLREDLFKSEGNKNLASKIREFN